MSFTPKSLFLTFATTEMFTWALLIAGLAIRAFSGLDPNLFFIVGATHGFAFLGYSVTAVLVAVNQRWSVGRSGLAVVLAIIPFATLPFEKSLERKGLLEGQWRTAAGTNPSDNSRFDAVFRWFIARPLILVFLLAGFVIVLFSVLLWVGPPYEWGK
ncbi:MAG: DUF3817 domain-containing protein [Actinomycetota bacterium]